MITLKSQDKFNQKILKKGFSKRAFAKKCGVSESAFIQISNGKQSPRPETAKKICESLNHDFDDIFEIKEKEGV
ncbi:helix-turn-helix transcriptional regulator [Salicibibacter kimchii]|uniref:XRE family transcriptional regulator n=1 Tax=Salicibibacter kimchii TaxID=2099786 RepID=A0A345C2H8_9BACI|nr:helix-turn-helix transcriptional regulator [Salicibibacter kimchii]AXF57409.1 XRE family transcriptional regulator [Salicibibacter kimchii]